MIREYEFDKLLTPEMVFDEVKRAWNEQGSLGFKIHTIEIHFGEGQIILQGR